jgi:phytanoyl-CoA hydroxylase
MTPRTPKHLIATWVALEDTHEDAGPLEYFPGSHLIEQMKFSNGEYHSVESEMPEWQAYMNLAVERAGLKPARFAAKKGDVFIWHANLLHGGGPIHNPALTRKSLVFHFYSEQDCRADGSTLVPQTGAFWMKRAPQSVPEPVAAQIAGKLEFSESGYLDRYPDVASAVTAGSFVSGLAHYQMFGKSEGRLPC